MGVGLRFFAAHSPPRSGRPPHASRPPPPNPHQNKSVTEQQSHNKKLFSGIAIGAFRCDRTQYPVTEFNGGSFAWHCAKPNLQKTYTLPLSPHTKAQRRLVPHTNKNQRDKCGPLGAAPVRSALGPDRQGLGPVLRRDGRAGHCAFPSHKTCHTTRAGAASGPAGLRCWGSSGAGHTPVALGAFGPLLIGIDVLGFPDTEPHPSEQPYDFVLAAKAAGGRGAEQ